MIYKNRCPVRNHHLHKQPPEHASETGNKIFVPEKIFLFNGFNLRKKVFAFLDRTRNQLREEAYKECIINDVLLGLDFTAVNIDDIADGLECIERNADGKQKMKRAL